jgi:predicted dehydrogenase
VASRRGGVPRDSVGGRVFADYDEALRQSDADLVYVSTRNVDHRALAAGALASGRHVVIDKPATGSVAEATSLVELAARQGRLVAEATVYPWHPQFDRVRSLVEEWGPVERAMAVFSIPPLEPDNFRYRADAAGGILWDLGPYAVSPGRLFFDAALESVSACSTTRPGDEVETSFGALLRYTDGRTLVGQFSMTAAYLNRLDLFGPRYRITIERAFTSAVDLPCRVTTEAAGERATIDVPPADAFARFLEDVMSSAAAGRHDAFARALLVDAEALARLRAAALPSTRRM